MCTGKGHRISELWTDPRSGELSASRFSLLVVILLFVPANAVLQIFGYNLQVWDFLIKLATILAGIYGINSAVGSWKGQQGGE